MTDAIIAIACLIGGWGLIERREYGWATLLIGAALSIAGASLWATMFH